MQILQEVLSLNKDKQLFYQEHINSETSSGIFCANLQHQTFSDKTKIYHNSNFIYIRNSLILFILNQFYKGCQSLPCLMSRSCLFCKLDKNHKGDFLYGMMKIYITTCKESLILFCSFVLARQKKNSIIISEDIFLLALLLFIHCYN